MDECVLSPAPRALAIVTKDEVPNIVFVAPSPYIVAEEMEGVLACAPVHATVSTFTFAADEVKVGIALSQSIEMLAAFPLYAKAQYVILQSVDDFLNVVEAVCVEGPEVEFHLRMLLLKGRSEVVAIEADGAFGRPSTARV